MHKLLFLFFFLSSHFVFASTEATKNNLNDKALEEFESFVETLRENIENSSQLSTLVQQYDSCEVLGGGWRPRCPQEVTPFDSLRDYERAVKDKYYGYQAFILVDKSVSRAVGRRRSTARQAQTIYLFRRVGQEIQLINSFAVSTGREPRAGKSDTREGYMRVQWANRQYTSRTYGEAMPLSLWFESEYGTAIHQTSTSKCNSIGVRASAGCVRMCEGDAQQVFDFATGFGQDHPIVLLDKRTGVPIGQGFNAPIYRGARQSEVTQAPKVIRGYPVFVRIIDATSDRNKLAEIENLLGNPTQGFSSYFPAVSSQVINGLGI